MNSSAPTGTAVVSSTVATAGIVTDTAKDRSDDIDEALEEDPDVEQRNILSVASASLQPARLGELIHTPPVRLFTRGREGGAVSQFHLGNLES